MTSFLHTNRANVEAIRITNSQSEVRIATVGNDDDRGTPLLYRIDQAACSWLYFGAVWPDCEADNVLSDEWVSAAFDDPTVLRSLPGVCAVVLVNHVRDCILIATDRLGVQPIYYTTGHEPEISTHLGLLLSGGKPSGDINPDGAIDHFGFGYTIHRNRQLYAGVERLAPGTCMILSDGRTKIKQYWRCPPASQGEDWHAVPREEVLCQAASAIRAQCEGAILTAPKYIGLTAGRDSLCIASTLSHTERPIAFTYGSEQSADVIQGARLASRFEWDHHPVSVVSPTEAERYIAECAYHSGGLVVGTTSDMMRAFDRLVPAPAVFLSGEGGECIRAKDHLDVGAAEHRLAKDYITPKSYLAEVLAQSFKARLRDYPLNIIRRAKADLAVEDDHTFFSLFHRVCRQPGNFGLRHAALAPVVAKVSPFFSSRLIDLTYDLPARTYYNNDRIHTELIGMGRPDLLKFALKPVTAQTTTQNLDSRWRAGFGAAVTSLIRREGEKIDDVFDPIAVHRMCVRNETAPTREIWLLARIASFALMRGILAGGGTMAVSQKRRVAGPKLVLRRRRHGPQTNDHG